MEPIMNQHVLTDEIAVRYADGVDHVWAAWEPSLAVSEELLSAHRGRYEIDSDDLADALRRAQYRAHTTSEFAAGLVPPPSASHAHSLLVGTLAACRDTLGVLAVRAQLDELNDDEAEIGLHAVDATRDAFRSALSSTALVHAWVADDQVDPQWIEPAHRTSRMMSWVFWSLVIGCLGLFTVLLVELIVFSPAGS
jgi:hypothetical protein